jgi:hypothetical protein
VKNRLKAVLPAPAINFLRRFKNLSSKTSYKEWEHRLFAAPSPDCVKQKVLIRNGTPNATWIETGTYFGDTTNILSQSARQVFSIEPEPTLYANALRRFSSTGNVKIVSGASEDILPTLLQTLAGDINFWLDGHYSAGITFKGRKDTPIVDELSAIEKMISKFNKVVILVDDVRCFNPRNPDYAEYPSLDFLVDYARNNNLSWYIEHDIFVAKNF